jgi:hypothetical protein
VTSSIDRSSDRGGNFEIRSQSYDLWIYYCNASAKVG